MANLGQIAEASSEPNLVFWLVAKIRDQLD
jgi:hypothetical protein